jgi:hypothetical protein
MKQSSFPNVALDCFAGACNDGVGRGGPRQYVNIPDYLLALRLPAELV